MVRLLLSTLSLLLLVPVCRASHREALLIGNSAYPKHRLATPKQDVEAVARFLEKQGFHTTKVFDLKRAQVRDVVERFLTRIPTRGTAFVYFSGYAMVGEDDGKKDNYFVPVDCNLRNAREIGNQNYGVNELLELLNSKSGSIANFILVDGCYQHPGKSEEILLGLMDPGKIAANSFVGFAAPAGKVISPEKKLSAMVQRLTQESGASLTSALESVCASSTSTLDDSFALAEETEPAIAPPDKFREGKKPGEEWVNARGMVFCWCPPGTFAMGSPKGGPFEDDGEGQVKITLTDGFWFGKYELTLRENVRNVSRNALAKTPNEPITLVHFDNARNTAKTFTQMERKAGRLPKDWVYALPTEIEWEYAARAGTTAPFFFGNNIEDLPQYANFADKTLLDTRDSYYGYAHPKLNDGFLKLAPVGSFKANPWGIHDVYGNVWEWCQRSFESKPEGGVDPFGKVKGNNPVIRGGSWVSKGEYCRSAFRMGWSNREERNFIGLRIILRKKRAEDK